MRWLLLFLVGTVVSLNSSAELHLSEAKGDLYEKHFAGDKDVSRQAELLQYRMLSNADKAASRSMDGAVSGKRRRRRRGRRLCARLYQHANFRGRVYNVYGNVRFLRGFNDQLSSLRVYRGCRVTLYQHSRYRGRRYTYRGGRRGRAYNFNTIRKTIGNDQVSSVSVRRGRARRRRVRRRRHRWYSVWRWGRRTKTVRGRKYRQRIHFKCRRRSLFGRKCRRTGRKYWRRVRRRRRRRRRRSFFRFFRFFRVQATADGSRRERGGRDEGRKRY
jgi:hypothetical protein